MPRLDIQILDPRFEKSCARLKPFCKKVIQAAWFSAEPAEISLVLADDDFVQDLNCRYRNKNAPTNVLSFESGLMPEKGIPWLAGDIVLAYQTVLKEAQDQGKSFEAHLCHLLTHGALHLQGYDHLEEKEAEKMEAVETFLLRKQGFRDPYEGVL